MTSGAGVSVGSGTMDYAGSEGAGGAGVLVAWVTFSVSSGTLVGSREGFAVTAVSAEGGGGKLSSGASEWPLQPAKISSNARITRIVRHEPFFIFHIPPL